MYCLNQILVCFMFGIFGNAKDGQIGAGLGWLSHKELLGCVMMLIMLNYYLKS